MRFLPLCLFFLLLAACEGNTAARKAARGFDYVADPDHLYFKNLRQRAYRSVTRETGVEEFSHDNLLTSTARLHPLIVDRWIDDSAQLYLAFRPTRPEDLRRDPFDLEFSRRRGELEIIQIDGALTETNIGPIYEALRGNNMLTINYQRLKIDAFPEGAGRREAVEVFRDYLKLIGGGPSGPTK